MTPDREGDRGVPRGREGGDPGKDAKADPAREQTVLPEMPKSSGLVKRRLVVEDARRQLEDLPAELPEKGPVEMRKPPAGEEPPETEEPPSRPIDPANDLGAPAGSVGGPVRRRRRSKGKRRRPKGEDAWTGGSGVSLWWVLAGFLCLGALAFLLKDAFEGTDAPKKLSSPDRVEPSVSLSEIPIGEFVEQSGALLPVLRELLLKFQTAEAEAQAQTAGSLLRGGARSAALLEEWRADGRAPRRLKPDVAVELHAAEIAGTAFLLLVGRTSDHLPAAAYFVKEGVDYKYDWQASEGYSELLPRDVPEYKGKEAKLMRVVMSLSAFYTPHFPEAEYRSYAMHHRDAAEFVWAYAKRNTLLDRSLLATLKSRDLPGTENRATVRVRRGPEGCRPNQLEIVEFLHADWLTPRVLEGAQGLNPAP